MCDTRLAFMFIYTHIHTTNARRKCFSDDCRRCRQWRADQRSRLVAPHFRLRLAPADADLGAKNLDAVAALCGINEGRPLCRAHSPRGVCCPPGCCWRAQSRPSPPECGSVKTARAPPHQFVRGRSQHGVAAGARAGAAALREHKRHSAARAQKNHLQNKNFAVAATLGRVLRTKLIGKEQVAHTVLFAVVKRFVLVAKRHISAPASTRRAPEAAICAPLRCSVHHRGVRIVYVLANELFQCAEKKPVRISPLPVAVLVSAP